MAQCSHYYLRCHSTAGGAAVFVDTVNPSATGSWHRLLKVLQTVFLLPYALYLLAALLFLELFPQLKQEKRRIKIRSRT